MTEAAPNAVIFYDGVCGLCNRLVQFVLARDAKAFFKFAQLQSPLAQKVLGERANDLDSLYVVAPDGDVLKKSRAALFVLRHVGWIWVAPALIVPRFIADAVYDFIARHRYGWFGNI